MIEQVTWDSEDGEPLIDAVVTRCTLFQDEMVILYKGADRFTQQPYDGRLNLKLHGSDQEFNGSYSHRGDDVPFSLTGRFIDDGFLSFEGRWIEKSWIARFYF